MSTCQWYNKRHINSRMPYRLGEETKINPVFHKGEEAVHFKICRRGGTGVKFWCDTHNLVHRTEVKKMA